MRIALEKENTFTRPGQIREILRPSFIAGTMLLLAILLSALLTGKGAKGPAELLHYIQWQITVVTFFSLTAATTISVIRWKNYPKENQNTTRTEQPTGERSTPLIVSLVLAATAAFAGYLAYRITAPG